MVENEWVALGLMTKYKWGKNSPTPCNDRRGQPCSRDWGCLVFAYSRWNPHKSNIDIKHLHFFSRE